MPDLSIADARESNGPSIVRFVNKDTSQTHLRIGHLSIKEHDPDYVALAIANDILGGSSFRAASTTFARNADSPIQWAAG